MKKWSIMAILKRMPDFDFTIQAKEPEDETMTTICTSNQFRTKLKQKYWSMMYATGEYFDPEDGYTELAEDVNDAVTMFTEAFNVWRDDRKMGFLKYLNALRSHYDPIWNVDGVEIETIIRDLDTTRDTDKTNKGTQTTADTGTQTTADTGTQTTNETGTDQNAHTGTITTANTGTQANAKTGTEKTVSDDSTLTQTSPYDDNLFYNKEKVDTDNDDTTTYNTTDTRTDNLNELQTNALTDLETKNLQTQRTDNLSSLRTDNLQSQRTDNLTENVDEAIAEDETTKRTLERHGNIGVTKTQELIESQRDVMLIDCLIEYIVQLFVQENLTL